MWAVVSITGILCMTLDGVMLALFGQMLHVFFYPLTPTVVPLILIGLSGIWIAIRPFSTVARNVQFWFPLIILSFGFVLFFKLLALGADAVAVGSSLLFVLSHEQMPKICLIGIRPRW